MSIPKRAINTLHPLSRRRPRPLDLTFRYLLDARVGLEPTHTGVKGQLPYLVAQRAMYCLPASEAREPCDRHAEDHQDKEQ